MNRKSGFTLVELSIVLIIIGLIIGGILVAQSMINTAKIQAQIKQVEQIEIVVRSFKTKFNQLPGDSKFFTTAGNADGKIDISDVSNLGDWGDYWEGKRVFNHLAQAQMLDFKSFTDTDNDLATVPGIGYPKMILNAKTSYGGTGGIMIGWEEQISYIKAGNNIKLGACSGFSPVSCSSGTGSNYLSFVAGPSTVEALAIDTKIDDGKPYSGNTYITGPSYSYAVPNGLLFDTTGSCGDFTSNSYKLNSTGTCALEFYEDF